MPPGLAAGYQRLFLHNQVVDISFIFLTEGWPLTGFSEVVANYHNTK